MPFPTIHAGQLILNYRVLRSAGPRDHNNMKPWEAECVECGEHFVRADQNWRKCKTPCTHSEQRNLEYQKGLERNAEERYFALLLCLNNCGHERCDQFYPYCSRNCRRLHARIQDRSAGRRSTPIERECYGCSVKFLPEHAGRTNFCDDCKRNDRIRNVWHETVRWRRVMERDRWRCQHCKTETPEFLRNTQLSESPELDHVLPIACGGAHSYANTQCLCRACNAKKSDDITKEPRLVGVADLTPFKVAKYPPTAKSGRPKKPAKLWMDLTGRTFGLLTVERYLGNSKKGYLCRCRCGRTRRLTQAELTGGAGRQAGKGRKRRPILLCCYGGQSGCVSRYRQLLAAGKTGNKRVDALAAA